MKRKTVAKDRRRFLAAGRRTLGAPQKIRACALAGAVAMAIHRAVALLGPFEPLGAVLPFFVFVACAMIAVLAGPIARAWERLER